MKTDTFNSAQTTDIHIKNLPLKAWRVARSAATLAGLPVAVWVAEAIFEKWERVSKEPE